MFKRLASSGINFLVLVISIAVFACAFFGMIALGKVQRPATIVILTASRNLRIGETITQADITEKSVYKDENTALMYIPADQIADVTGGIVALPINQGQPIMRNSILSPAGENTLADERVVVRFDGPLHNAAGEVLRVYPLIRDELLKNLGWKTAFRPEIALVRDSVSFRKISESDLVSAVALPHKDLIVIDYSKMNIHPFTLETTLKHEMCHLELHHHIQGGKLPRWLDEGVCQWVTGGLSEIMTDGNRSTLRTATLSNRLISIERLSESFPADRKDLVLAYEESRSLVEYIEKEFGASGVLRTLEYMSSGDNVEVAVQKSLLLSLEELQSRWRSSLVRKTSWFSYIGDNLYEILFLFAALTAIYGFFVVLKKKRAYKDEDAPEEEEA